MATQLNDGEIDPDQLIASIAFGGYGGLFQSRYLPALVGFNALLSTDKRLCRELIHRKSSPQTITPNGPSSPSAELPPGQTPSGGK